MRLSVASTGGATGSGSGGRAACFNAAYSLTGSTTQPSAEVWAVIGRAKTNRDSRPRASCDTGKRSRFMVNLLLNLCALLRGTRRDNAASRRKNITRTFVDSRSRCDLFVKLPLRCSEVAQSSLGTFTHKEAQKAQKESKDLFVLLVLFCGIKT